MLFLIIHPPPLRCMRYGRVLNSNRSNEFQFLLRVCIESLKLRTQQRKKPRLHHICLTVLFTFPIFMFRHVIAHICRTLFAEHRRSYHTFSLILHGLNRVLLFSFFSLHYYFVVRFHGVGLTMNIHGLLYSSCLEKKNCSKQMVLCSVCAVEHVAFFTLFIESVVFNICSLLVKKKHKLNSKTFNSKFVFVV